MIKHVYMWIHIFVDSETCVHADNEIYLYLYAIDCIYVEIY